ncbi:hypothetical protein BHM03_00055235 [Ensete ventricosum]|nr:hypothetical protein BHM03_00055235 [Ensete ventricosum]
MTCNNNCSSDLAPSLPFHCYLSLLMRKASSTYRYHYSILLLLLLLVDMQNTGAYSSYSHRCNPNDLGALYGFSRRLITHQIHDWPLADANFTNCCSWPGVSCALFSSSPISSSSSTNSSGLSVTRVVGLDLSGKGLDGVLSTSLAVLDKLSFLNLSYNFIPRPHPAGAIPLEALKGARPRQKPLVRRATTGCSKPHKPPPLGCL